MRNRNTSRAGSPAPHPRLLLLGLALAAGLVDCRRRRRRSLERIKLAGDKITVKGYAEEKVVSDAGTLACDGDGAGPADLQSGYRELEADTASVLKMLATVAGESATVTTTAVKCRPQYEVGPGACRRAGLIGYELDRNFELSSADVALIGKVATQASSLISEGVNINSWPPQYFYNDLNAVKVRLIGARPATHSSARSSSRRAAA